jgi:CRISPR-associated protein Cmr3
MKRIEFLSLDTLFFRDGSPFNANELQSGAQTCFPPSPQTLVGAIRASAASELGWNGENRGSNWDEHCREALGTGNDLGPLRFRGPFLFRNGEPLFPVPADLLGKPTELNEDPDAKVGRPADLVRLRPGRTPRDCDLGSVRLPEAARDNITGRKQLHGDWWMNLAGISAVASGDCPSPQDLIHRGELWKVEARVGISRDPDSRTTREQALYAPRHIRPQSRVCVNMFVEGLSQQAAAGMAIPRVQSVGGESRGCWLDVSDAALPVPAPLPWSVVDNKLRYSVLVLTPLATSSPPLPNEAFLGLPGVVVSACLPRPQFWGGWDSVENRPLPLTPHLAPGSVVFLEADAREADGLRQWHGTSIGDKCAWGFGVIVLGTWNS